MDLFGFKKRKQEKIEKRRKEEEEKLKEKLKESLYSFLWKKVCGFKRRSRPVWGHYITNKNSCQEKNEKFF